MAIVLSFLLGMPLVAIPQLSAPLASLLFANPGVHVAKRQPFVTQPDRATNKRVAEGHGTTVTTLASDRSQPPMIRPNPVDLAAKIEALKAQFVEAGVSYMVLERTGTDSTQYRFRFDMPVAAGSAYRKRFQVVNDAPDEAMRQALTELRQWRVADREPAYLERPTVILR